MQKITSKFLIFFGAPGVGKGTYGKLFSRRNKFQQISPGEELRKLINRDSIDNPKILSLKSILSKGKLVDDESIIGTSIKKIITRIGL